MVGARVSSVSLTAESVIELAPHEAFALFGRAEAGTWLFDARCDSVAVGAPIRMVLPIADASDRHRVELLGRVSEVRPGRLIVVEHVQPWQGKIRLSFQPHGVARTRVRVRADVSESAVEWLVRHHGILLPHSEGDADTLRIGLVTSKSGPLAVCMIASEYLAQLAVDDINDGGGVRERQVELMVADDESIPSIAATEARRLQRAGCHAIFACGTSASFAAIDQAVSRDVLAVHASMNERGNHGRGAAVQVGERPEVQIAVMADRIRRTAGAHGWFLVGEQYSWSYGAHRAARQLLPRSNGRILGESSTPLGTTDFSPIIDMIERSGADVVMSSLVGADEVEFERQCAAAGLRSRTCTLSLTMEETTLDYIGPESAEGIWTALGYHEAAPTDGNERLVSRYRQRFGPWAPPVSTLSETVYEAIVQYADAVRRRGEAGEPLPVRDFIAHLEDAAGDGIGTRNLLRPSLQLARVEAGARVVFDEVG